MVDADFKKAVASNRLENIRDFLRMRLTLDHNYVSGMFIECLNYCFSHGITEAYLYEKFDGRELPSSNTEDNFTKLLGQLSTNFAKERVNRLLEIGKKLWPEEQGDFEKEKTSTHNSEVSKSSERRVISEKIIQNDNQNTGKASERRIISERPVSTSTGNYKNNDTKKDDEAGFYEKQNSSSNTDSKSTNTALLVGAAAIIVAGVIIAVALLG